MTAKGKSHPKTLPAPEAKPDPEMRREENPTTLFAYHVEGERKGKARSRMLVSAESHAGTTVYGFVSMKDGANITDLVECVRDAANEAIGGKLDRQEATLAAQAQSLDVIFNELAQKAAANIRGGYLTAGEACLRMALKAQSQCRTTIEALGELKYPKSTNFIRQQNIANQQQVNNGSATSTPAPARAHEKDITPTNELLTENRSATLDTGRAAKAIGANPKLEAVGAVHRPAN